MDQSLTPVNAANTPTETPTARSNPRLFITVLSLNQMTPRCQQAREGCCHRGLTVNIADVSPESRNGEAPVGAGVLAGVPEVADQFVGLTSRFAPLNQIDTCP